MPPRPQSIELVAYKATQSVSHTSCRSLGPEGRRDSGFCRMRDQQLRHKGNSQSLHRSAAGKGPCDFLRGGVDWTMQALHILWAAQNGVPIEEACR